MRRNIGSSARSTSSASASRSGASRRAGVPKFRSQEDLFEYAEEMGIHPVAVSRRIATRMPHALDPFSAVTKEQVDVVSAYNTKWKYLIVKAPDGGYYAEFRPAQERTSGSMGGYLTESGIIGKRTVFPTKKAAYMTILKHGKKGGYLLHKNPRDWSLAYEGRLRDLSRASDGLIRVRMNSSKKTKPFRLPTVTGDTRLDITFEVENNYGNKSKRNDENVLFHDWADTFALMTNTTVHMGRTEYRPATFPMLFSDVARALRERGEVGLAWRGKSGIVRQTLRLAGPVSMSRKYNPGGDKFYVAIDDLAGEEPTVWRGPFSRDDAEAQAAEEHEHWRGQYSARVVSGAKKPKPQPRHFSELSQHPGEEEYYANLEVPPGHWESMMGRKNPKRAKYVSAREAGLARGQSLMAQAAEAFHAGMYPNMAAALKGVSGKGGR